MNIWENAVITSKGLALQSKLTQGTSLTLTRAVAGAGYITPALLVQQTAVLEPKQELKFSPVSYPEEGKCVVPVYLTNEGLKTGYTAKQVGIYATDPNEGEILYFICQSASGKGTEVPSETEMGGYNAEWNFYFQYGQADEVTVVVDPAGVAHANHAEQHKPGGNDPLDPADIGAVPTGRKINNKELTADINLTYSDVGAASAKAHNIPSFWYEGQIGVNLSAESDTDFATNVKMIADAADVTGGVEIFRFANTYSNNANMAKSIFAKVSADLNQTMNCYVDVVIEKYDAKYAQAFVYPQGGETWKGYVFYCRVDVEKGEASPFYVNLHTGNKHLIFTYGTEDLVAGETPLGTGMLHFVYE